MQIIGTRISYYLNVTQRGEGDGWYWCYASIWVIVLNNICYVTYERSLTWLADTPICAWADPEQDPAAWLCTVQLKELWHHQLSSLCRSCHLASGFSVDGGSHGALSSERRYCRSWNTEKKNSVQEATLLTVQKVILIFVCANRLIRTVLWTYEVIFTHDVTIEGAFI